MCLQLGCWRQFEADRSGKRQRNALPGGKMVDGRGWQRSVDPRRGNRRELGKASPELQASSLERFAIALVVGGGVQQAHCGVG
jgi:hypothetical protein